MSEPFFPFLLRCYETPSAMSEGITTHNPQGFREVFAQARLKNVSSYHCYDVEVLSPTLVKFHVYGMRDNVYGGIGEYLYSMEAPVPKLAVSSQIEARLLKLAHKRRDQELRDAEEAIVGGYMNEMRKELGL